MTRVCASIEARMTSSRFPGKMMADINGAPSIVRLINRVKACQSLDGVVLATTTNKEDDVLVEQAEKAGISSYRGSEDDVLNRVVEAQKSIRSDIVVEIVGDGILLDPEIVDVAVDTFLANDCDVVSNTWKRSWPVGVSVQVFPLEKLEWVDRNVADPAVHEHVSLYFYENPEAYRIIHLMSARRLRAPHDWRFHLDYPEDLEFLNRVYKELEPERGELFSTADVMDLIDRNPELPEINRHCEERSAR